MGWLKSSASRLLDPQRDARVNAAAKEIERRLVEHRDGFELRTHTVDLGLFSDEVHVAAEETFTAVVKRAWRDGDLTDKERRSLTWIASRLGIQPKRAETIVREAGVEAFGATLDRAIADGRLEQAEIDQLQRIAAQMNTDLGGLMTHLFDDVGSGLLRGMFKAATADGTITSAEWSRILAGARQLGLTDDQVLAAIEQPAKRFVEQTLADAKADETLSVDEKASLQWLIRNIIHDPNYQHYVTEHVTRFETVRRIAKGDLPSIQGHFVGIRSGEIVHLSASGTYMQVKALKSGPSTVRHDGTLLVTDSRLLFTSPTLGLDISHRKVLDVSPFQQGYVLQTSGKGNGTWYVAGDSELVGLIYLTAVRRANQTIVYRDETEVERRRIPRDVRQRVWQRDGGRCVECGADQYLEFDHVIPVTKGGGNSEQNVQLLCRGCNLKKSAHL
jgi:hypothetical protein